MPSKLVLNSLEIRNFRGLRELRIEKLGRANLIVGKNNVGKTSVLEALRLYAQPGSAEVLLELLESRDEINTRSGRIVNQQDPSPVPIESLFYERVPAISDADSIRIGPFNSPDETLSIRAGWLRQRNLPNLEELESTDSGRPILHFQKGTRDLRLPASDLSELRRLSRFPGLQRTRVEKLAIKSFFVSANSLNPIQIGRLWDSIALTELENDVLTALRMIAKIERLSLVIRDESSAVRIPVIKTRELDQPVPLRSMGEGLNRIFGIALALVNAKDGLLLVDEIENGVHYTAQPDLWRFVFRAAERLNVQVFATTHSYDCIKAFQKAADESPEDGMLIRLARKNGRILTGEFDEDELEIAVEEQIEVR